MQEGFWYHHAEPDYLMLVLWIPKIAHTLPANASHRVGIGAFVINSKREVSLLRLLLTMKNKASGYFLKCLVVLLVKFVASSHEWITRIISFSFYGEN